MKLEKVHKQENKELLLPKNANTFKRLLSSLIDILIFVLIGLSTSLICIIKTNINVINGKGFSTYIINDSQIYLYYIWLIILLLSLYIQYFQIPLLTKGRTIGMLATFLSLQSNDDENIIKKTFKRFCIGPLIWIIVILLFIAFIQVKTANKLIIFSYIQQHDNEIQKMLGDNKEAKNQFINQWMLNSFDVVVITFPSTISSITIVAQVLLIISIGVNKNKVGIIDKVTNSQIIYKNKFNKQMMNNTTKIIEPEISRKIEIIWKN